MTQKPSTLFPFISLLVGLSLAGFVQADEVEVNLTPAGEAFVGGCMSGGYNEGTCVCLISHLIDDKVTAEDLQDLQPEDYATQLQDCAEANGDVAATETEEIELNLTEAGQAFLSGCQSGGYSEGACVCLISRLIEDGVTADDLESIDIQGYAEDLNECDSVN